MEYRNKKMAIEANSYVRKVSDFWDFRELWTDKQMPNYLMTEPVLVIIVSIWIVEKSNACTEFQS